MITSQIHQQKYIKIQVERRRHARRLGFSQFRPKWFFWRYWLINMSDGWRILFDFVILFLNAWDWILSWWSSMLHIMFNCLFPRFMFYAFSQMKEFDVNSHNFLIFRRHQHFLECYHIAFLWNVVIIDTSGEQRALLHRRSCRSINQSYSDTWAKINCDGLSFGRMYPWPFSRQNSSITPSNDGLCNARSLLEKKKKSPRILSNANRSIRLLW